MTIIAHVDDYVCQYDECLEPEDKGWICEEISKGVAHVYPNYDWQEHILTESCRCTPRISREGLGVVVVHNSFDGREAFEKLDDLKPGRLNH